MSIETTQPDFNPGSIWAIQGMGTRGNNQSDRKFNSEWIQGHPPSQGIKANPRASERPFWPFGSLSHDQARRSERVVQVDRCPSANLQEVARWEINRRSDDRVLVGRSSTRHYANLSEARRNFFPSTDRWLHRFDQGTDPPDRARFTQKNKE